PELGERRLRPEDASLDVDAKQLVARRRELFLGDLGERNRAIEDSRIADEDVEPAEGFDGLGNGALVVIEPDHVTVDGDHRLAQLRPELLDPGRDAIHDADARPFVDEARHDRLSDSRAAAGHQRNLSIEPAHGQLLVGDYRTPFTAGMTSR